VTKSLIAYIFGIVFVSIGLIPIARNIFSIDQYNDAPIFFLAGGVWLFFIIILLKASNVSKRQLFKKNK
tara:strand:+ start:558 stop:764 length:207 start_codon:yes stop_codon:yes gene_type:complete